VSAITTRNALALERLSIISDGDAFSRLSLSLRWAVFAARTRPPASSTSSSSDRGHGSSMSSLLATRATTRRVKFVLCMTCAVSCFQLQNYQTVLYCRSSSMDSDALRGTRTSTRILASKISRLDLQNMLLLLCRGSLTCWITGAMGRYSDKNKATGFF